MDSLQSFWVLEYPGFQCPLPPWQENIFSFFSPSNILANPLSMYKLFQVCQATCPISCISEMLLIGNGEHGCPGLEFRMPFSKNLLEWVYNNVNQITSYPLIKIFQWLTLALEIKSELLFMVYKVCMIQVLSMSPASACTTQDLVLLLCFLFCPNSFKFLVYWLFPLLFCKVIMAFLLYIYFFLLFQHIWEGKLTCLAYCLESEIKTSL